MADPKTPPPAGPPATPDPDRAGPPTPRAEGKPDGADLEAGIRRQADEDAGRVAALLAERQAQQARHDFLVAMFNEEKREAERHMARAQMFRDLMTEHPAPAPLRPGSIAGTGNGAG